MPVRTLRVPARTLLCAASIAACSGARDEAPIPFHIERIQVGDTTVIRNLGTNSDSLEIQLVRETVLGDIDRPVREHFGRVLQVSGRPDGSVFVGDALPARMQLFDAEGRFVRSFGRAGSGPGEFQVPGQVAVDGRGLIYHTALPFRISVFDSTARLVNVWDTPSGVYGWYVDSIGTAFHHFTIYHETTEELPKRSTPYVLLHSRDGRVIDTTEGPLPYGERLTFPVRYEGEMKRETLPLSPGFEAAFGAPGAWVFGFSEQYVLHVKRLDGTVLRIESDRVRVPTQRGEREELALDGVAMASASGRNGRIGEGDIPRFKPHFKRIEVAPDGRIWVTLHTAAVRSTVTKCPSTALSFSFSSGGPVSGLCSDDRPPRPMDVWTEPTVYDVFESTGELLGTVSLPTGVIFRSANGDVIWASERSETEGTQLMRYRMIVPRAVTAALAGAAPAR